MQEIVTLRKITLRKQLINNKNAVSLETRNRHKRNRLSENKIFPKCQRGGGVLGPSQQIPQSKQEWTRGSLYLDLMRFGFESVTAPLFPAVCSQVQIYHGLHPCRWKLAACPREG